MSGESGAGRRPLSRARIERVFDHTQDTRSLFLRIVEGARPRWTPGMFISISIPLADETRVRPYTIASSPEDGEPLEIVFNRVPGGAGVAWLFERKEGDEIGFTGPFGAFTLERAPEQELVFIAEATSIAPIRPMLRRVFEHQPSRPVHLLYAADRDDHLLFRREIEGHVMAHPQFRFETVVDEAGHEALYARVIAEVERRWVAADNDRTRRFYVCGVGAGVLKVRDVLRGAGYERHAVRYELW